MHGWKCVTISRQEQTLNGMVSQLKNMLKSYWAINHLSVELKTHISEVLTIRADVVNYHKLMIYTPVCGIDDSSSSYDAAGGLSQIVQSPIRHLSPCQLVPQLSINVPSFQHLPWICLLGVFLTYAG
jgi:hypothetical protein